jgi:glycosyltransferase involved in cell wall biosynthesis
VSIVFKVIEESRTGLLGDNTRNDNAPHGAPDDTPLLDERERALVVSAANFHSFANPGSKLRFTVLRAPAGTHPSLCDHDVSNTRFDLDRDIVASLLVESLAAGPATNAFVDLIIDVGGSLLNTNRFEQIPGVRGHFRRSARLAIPVLYDQLRQVRTDQFERRTRNKHIPPRSRVQVARATAPSSDCAPPAILFGLHWLEMGGAERWALQSIQLAKSLGFTPIVLTDQDSQHPWITRPELDGAVVMPLTHPMTIEQETAMLGGVFNTFDVRGIHIHHCDWLYARLPWLKAIRPEVTIVDTLHIREWRIGGFVEVSLNQTRNIDYHHVISPQLRDIFHARLRDEQDKIVLATLAHLTVRGIAPSARSREEFTVGFIGRLQQQKRPFLFLKLAAKMRKRFPGRFRFVMHGDGDLSTEVQELYGAHRLGDVLERRDSTVPIERTLGEIDALVLCSDNEGLALTTFEAAAAGIPVVSTDVGSQATLVSERLLCDRHPVRFLKAATELLNRMDASPRFRTEALAEQDAKATEFAAYQDAITWTEETYRGWKP